MLEWLAPGFIYSVIKDGLSAILPRKLSKEAIVQLRTKWKAEIEPKIFERYRDKLRRDVIVRDVNRVDSYPDISDANGISPWFRVGLIGTYHRGILLGLGWGKLIKEASGEWRYARPGEEGARVLLIGRVRYEDIRSIDWNGDEFYGFPHIYCAFRHHREPYEDKGFYTENVNPGGLPFHTLIAPFDPVRRRSEQLGIEYFI